MSEQHGAAPGLDQAELHRLLALDPDQTELDRLLALDPGPGLDEAELDRLLALDPGPDPDEPADPNLRTVEAPVLLIDPTVPDSDPDQWWTTASMFAPTGYLLDELDQLPIDRLDPEQALQVAKAAEQLTARAQAIQVKAIASFAALRPADREYGASAYAPNLFRYAPDELGCALGVSRQAAGTKLRLAHELTQRLPGTLAALHAGRIDAGKARVLADGTGLLTVQQAHAVEQHVLQRAGHQTHSAVRAATNRAVLKADPAAGLKRREVNVAQRAVELFPQDDGVSDLWARLPAEVAAACYDRLCQLADTARTPGDARTGDQRRADVFTDLLLGSKTGGGVQAQILVLTRETSLLRIDDDPGELIGTGPLPAEVVRQIAEQPTGSIWRRLLTDPTSGTPTDLGRTRYRPTAGLDEFVRMRALVCYFPGCQRPAIRCDLDHLQAASQGGHTNAANLGPACRHHHPITDGPNATWTVTQPRPGIYEVTSPTGRTYQSDPQPLLEPPGQPAQNDHDPPPF